MGRLQLHQALTPAALRERVRTECLQRVQDQRSALLWRMREIASEGSSARDVLATVIADVTGDIQNTHSPQTTTPPGSCHQNLLSTPLGQPGNAAWGEGEAQAPSGARFGSAALGAIGTPQAPRPEYCPNDDVELLLMMERALYEDVLRAQADEAAADEAAAVDAMVDMHLASPSEAGVPCPVCAQAWLAERAGVIACPRGDLMLDLRAEGLGLEHLRARLADAYEAHAGSGCGAAPAFAPQEFKRGGPYTLLMSCAACGALQVIV
jgi:hypothetical protein